MFKFVKKVVLSAASALGLMAVSAQSMAAMDTAGVTTALTDAGDAVAVVGGAVLVVVVGIAAFGYVRRAIGK